MTTTSPARPATPDLVRQLVRGIHEQLADRIHPEPLVIGVRARPQWDHGPIDDPIAGRIEVAACPTPLAARRAIADFAPTAVGDEATLVVLSDLADTDLGADLLGRFVSPRLRSLNVWETVCARFGVRSADPAFGDDRFAWMAEPLLDVPPDSVPSGASVLSLEAGLRAVTISLLGAVDITLERILAATPRPDFAQRVDRTDPATIERLCTTLSDRLGPAGELASGMISKGRGEQALAAGLAARTVVGDVGGTYAQAKVGGLTGVEHPTDQALDAWSRAAERTFTDLDANGDPVVDSVAFTGSRLATEWQAAHPGASDVLGVSFEARLEVLGTEVEQMLDSAVTPDPDRLRSSVARVVGHREATTDVGRSRAQRARLAARLATWLRDPISLRHGTGVDPARSSDHLSLSESIRGYLSDGAWVDAARRRVGEGDDTPHRFATALTSLAGDGHERRALGNRSFAEALARWSADGTGAQLADDIVAVEDVLDDMVVPLARQQPVLVVVLDGCGLPAFVELADQFRHFGLAEIGRSAQRAVGLAAMPTVTAVSRTSLLTGTLQVGTASDESKGLPSHPKVAKLDGPPAVVFHHRPDLISGVGTSLPGAVLAALESGGPRVVAAVVNTIDDELSRGDFTPEYRIENLGPLAALLRAAVDGGRLVIVTADHGHVLGVGLDGRGQVARAGEGGDRWRLADRAPSDDEVLLKGPRVLMGDDRGVLAPWHDDLRYSAKHGGYHGGATPDECLVPLAVFEPIGVERPKGYEPVSVATPIWWDLHVESPVELEPTPVPPKRRRRKGESEGQVPLFPEVPTEPPTSGDSREGGAGGGRPSGPSAPWIDELLSSDVYALQLGSIPRSKPREELVRPTLGALHARGGVSSFAVVAQSCDIAPMRVPGFLATLSRVLNVDGYGVLTVDASAAEVRLDEVLLRTQFLDGGS